MSMNRRGFLKCIALTPLVGLLKPGKVFKGEITDVQVFDKVLTDKEISRLCNTTSEVYGKSPIQSAYEDMRRLNEIAKFHHDMACFGSGAYQTDGDGNLKHIPIEQAMKEYRA